MVRKLSGQITVFAALIFAAVVALIVTTVRSAAFSVGFLRADLVAYAGVTSEFSQYFRPLAENFNILGLEIVDDMDKEIEGYIRRSIENDNSLISVDLSGVKIKNYVKMTDNCGLPMKEQVVNYMKYGQVSDFINMLMGNEAYKRKCDTIKSLNDELTQVAEIIVKMDENLIMAASSIDGIGAENGMFLVQMNAPTYSGKNFLKMATSSENLQKIGIGDGRIYFVIQPHLQNMRDLLIKLVLESYSSNSTKGAATLLANLARDCADGGQVALNYCKSYQKYQNTLRNRLNELDVKLQANRSVIGDDVYAGLKEETAEMHQFADGKNKKLFDVENMITALERNIQTLNVIEKMSLNVLTADYEAATNMISEMATLIADYSCEDMIIDYSEIKFEKDNNVLKMLKTMYDNIGKEVVEIVGENQEISRETLNLSSLALSKYSSDKDKVAAAGTSLYEKALFVEYLSNNFDCFGDFAYEDGGFKYDLEFILMGGNSDYDNFSKVINSIVFLREGPNLMCLLTDHEKKSEAYAMSLALLGATGSEGIVKLGQYLILTAWSYSESIMDAKRLVNGDKLDLLKSKSDWVMSLHRMLSFDYSYQKNNKNIGLGYKEYLKLLFMFEKESIMYYTAMSAMEMRMVALGYGEFRMENFICQMSSQIDFLVAGQIYEKKTGYKY